VCGVKDTTGKFETTKELITNKLQKNLASRSRLLHSNGLTSKGVKELEYPSKRVGRWFPECSLVPKCRSTSLSPPD